MYQTADSVSSNDGNKQHSERMVDALLLNNGYSSRVLQQIKLKKEQRRPRKRRKSKVHDSVTTLKVPFLSDKCTARIKRAAESLKIPVRVVTTPGRKLRDLLTSSRPLDQKKCPNDDCLTCNALQGEQGKCTDHNVIYEIKCGFSSCQATNIGHYNGETYRPVGERFIEHYRSARNPNAPSYQDKPFAKHYSTQHKDCVNPKLELKILKRATTTTERKIKEARVILKNKPDLNNRDEQVDLRKYLV